MDAVVKYETIHPSKQLMRFPQTNLQYNKYEYIEGGIYHV